MARKTNKEYIEKLLKTKAPNDYKFDLIGYLYNINYSYNYPSFYKILEETEEIEKIRRVYYFKFFDRTGEYREEIYLRKKNETCQIIKEKTKNILEKSNRFNLKKLISFC